SSSHAFLSPLLLVLAISLSAIDVTTR
uniref:Uncharacterized protein n=1 Tax=Amphimedon queenslandica TaxID=400682 RepID=A0A1X7SMV6_AMPQE